MYQHVLNEDPLGRVIDPRNQPEFVSANIEYREDLGSGPNAISC